MADNSSFAPFPGQAYLGSDAHYAPQIFGAPVTVAGGLNAGGQVPTVTVGAGAGGGGAVSGVYGYDQACSFTVTAGTSPAAGALATVTFGAPLSSSPVSVVATVAGTAGALAAGATAISTTGFTVTSAAATASDVYTVCYRVVGSPV